MSNAFSGAGMSASDVVRVLDLAPHPEGGWFRETYRDPQTNEDGRSIKTLIYFLLGVGDVSHWHRVDAVEVWHYYAGAPLVITISPNGVDAAASRLGPDLLAGQRPQVVVPANHWQTATSLGEWTLVGCTVAPGFEFSGFELAPADWRPTPLPPGAR